MQMEGITPSFKLDLLEFEYCPLSLWSVLLPCLRKDQAYQLIMQQLCKVTSYLHMFAGYFSATIACKMT